jgi:protein-S-isoprenylcysteine O-methyltransferase Ste14
MRWSNVPIPEAHLVAIAAGTAMQMSVPLRAPLGDRVRWTLAAPLAAAGLALAAWAVASAGDADVERETALITNGAYAVTRNPMYIGWSAGILALAVASRSAWMLAAWSVAVLALDREIRAEESRLSDRFGAAYATYRARVPRYLPIPIELVTRLMKG